MQFTPTHLLVIICFGLIITNMLFGLLYFQAQNNVIKINNKAYYLQQELFQTALDNNLNLEQILKEKQQQRFTQDYNLTNILKKWSDDTNA